MSKGRSPAAGRSSTSWPRASPPRRPPPGARREPALRVNNVYGIYRAVQSGLGVGALPYYMSNEAPDLVEVLPGLKGPSFEAYFVYPEELRHSKRIAVVRDFLLQEIAQDTGRDDAPKPW